ncbi:hypothetical protein NPX13_g8203 [Xylaria arbuscula]|uniref:ABM domain-containing protein n=1 Tax=Xylaria arbuscula TaxID=114810 RepID=A0A9W8N8V2_9PEZI|nr:hypothetical protein NPX13_g8203 [Xylaria arbuscula]
MADDATSSTKWDIPEGEFCIFGTVYAYPDKADALEAVYTETTRLAQAETGIVYYCLARDRDDPSVFQFFERYKNQKAFEEHNSQPIIQKLLNEDKYIKDVTAKFMKPIGLESG